MTGRAARLGETRKVGRVDSFGVDHHHVADTEPGELLNEEHAARSAPSGDLDELSRSERARLRNSRLAATSRTACCRQTKPTSSGPAERFGSALTRTASERTRHGVTRPWSEPLRRAGSRCHLRDDELCRVQAAWRSILDADRRVCQAVAHPCHACRCRRSPTAGSAEPRRTHNMVNTATLESNT
jgi:hypothetical protein